MQSLAGADDDGELHRHFNFGLKSVARVWWFHRYVLLTSVILSTVGGLIFLQSQEKHYTAISLMKIKDVPNYIVKAGRRVSIDQRGSPAVASIIVSMSSRSLLANVAEKLDLHLDPEFKPNAAFVLDTENSPWKSDRNVAVKNAVVDLLTERVTINQRRGSHVISVEARSASPVRAAEIANAVAELFIDEERSRLRQSETRSLDWLKTKIEQIRNDLADHEKGVMEFASRHGVSTTGGHAVASRTFDDQWMELARQRVSIETERVEAQSRYQALVSMVESSGAGAVLSLAKSPAIEGLRRIEAELIGRVAELEGEYGERHPTMQRLRNDLETIRGRMEDEAASLLEKIKGDLIVSSAKQAEIEARLEVLERATHENRTAELKVYNSNNVIESYNDILSKLLEKKIAVEEKQFFRQYGTMILSRAKNPTEHSSPKLFPILAYVAFGGLLFALIFVFLRDRWVSDFGFRSPEDLRVVGIKPIGLVPELGSKESRMFTFYDHVIAHPQSVEAQAVQRIRNQLALDDSGYPAGARVVSIVSSSPLEGKTTMVLSLAKQAAAAGAKALVVDADIRNPNIHQSLGLDVKPGLCELLLHNKSEEDYIECVPDNHIHILQAGITDARPADLFSSSSIRSLLRRLREQYDCIFIDTPPLGAVADAVVLATHVDSVLYVTRWLETTRPVVHLGLDELRGAGVNSIGVALTRVDMKSYRKYAHLDELGYYGYYDLEAS